MGAPSIVAARPAQASARKGTDPGRGRFSRATAGSPALPRSGTPPRTPRRSGPPATRQDEDMTAPGNASDRSQQVVVVGPSGQPVGALPMPQGGDDGDGTPSVGGMVEQPAKGRRTCTRTKDVLGGARPPPRDAGSRNRLRDIHAASIRELEEGLSLELREEL